MHPSSHYCKIALLHTGPVCIVVTSEAVIPLSITYKLTLASTALLFGIIQTTYAFPALLHVSGGYPSPETCGLVQAGQQQLQLRTAALQHQLPAREGEQRQRAGHGKGRSLGNVHGRREGACHLPQKARGEHGETQRRGVRE